ARPLLLGPAALSRERGRRVHRPVLDARPAGEEGPQRSLPAWLHPPENERAAARDEHPRADRGTVAAGGRPTAGLRGGPRPARHDEAVAVARRRPDLAGGGVPDRPHPRRAGGAV